MVFVQFAAQLDGTFNLSIDSSEIEDKNNSYCLRWLTYTPFTPPVLCQNLLFLLPAITPGGKELFHSVPASQSKNGATRGGQIPASALSLHS